MPGCPSVGVSVVADPLVGFTGGVGGTCPDTDEACPEIDDARLETGGTWWVTGEAAAETGGTGG